MKHCVYVGLTVLLVLLSACREQSPALISYPHIVSTIAGWTLVLEQFDESTGAVQFSVRCGGRGHSILTTTIAFETGGGSTHFSVPQERTCGAKGASLYADTWPGIGNELDAPVDLTIKFEMVVGPKEPIQIQERRYVVSLGGSLYQQR